MRVTSRRIVGGNRHIRAVSVETLNMEAVSVDTLSIEAVSVETPIIQAEPRARAGLGRETTEGSCPATRQLPARTSKCCPQFTINECEKHSKSRLDTVTVGVDLSKPEKLTFLIDTGAEISTFKGASLNPDFIMSLPKGLM